MNSTQLARIGLLAALLALSSHAALAKGHATTQNHHCKMADGSMDMKQTKKQCLAAKGTWAKDADAAAVAKPALPAAPATAPAPKS